MMVEDSMAVGRKRLRRVVDVVVVDVVVAVVVCRDGNDVRCMWMRVVVVVGEGRKALLW